jgi:hypothetical protein
MLMYWYLPRSPLDVTLDSHNLDNTNDFLWDILEVQEFACQSIKTAQDRNIFHANDARKPREFHIQEHVCLRVTTDSDTLNTGSCAKFAPR